MISDESVCIYDVVSIIIYQTFLPTLIYLLLLFKQLIILPSPMLLPSTFLNILLVRTYTKFNELDIVIYHYIYVTVNVQILGFPV